MSAGGYATRSFPQSVKSNGAANGVTSFGTSAGYGVASGGFAFWFKAPPQNSAAFKVVVILIQDANNYAAIDQSSDTVFFGAQKGGVTVDFLNLGALNDSSWHHVVASWGIGGFLVMVDGNPIQVPDGVTDDRLTFTNPLLEVGGSSTLAIYYTCYVCQLALFNALLTVDQARAIYRDNLYPASLSSFWNFTEVTQGVALPINVPRTSGVGNNGTGGAAAAWSTTTPWGL